MESYIDHRIINFKISISVLHFTPHPPSPQEPPLAYFYRQCAWNTACAIFWISHQIINWGSGYNTAITTIGQVALVLFFNSKLKKMSKSFN